MADLGVGSKPIPFFFSVSRGAYIWISRIPYRHISWTVFWRGQELASLTRSRPSYTHGVLRRQAKVAPLREDDDFDEKRKRYGTIERSMLKIPGLWFVGRDF